MGRGSLVLVDDDPYPQLDTQVLWQDPDEVWVAAEARRLADADPEAGPDGGEERQVAVGAQGERLLREPRIALDDRAKRRGLPVKPDQIVMGEVGDRPWRSALGQIAAMRVEAQFRRRHPVGRRRDSRTPERSGYARSS